MTFIKTYQDEIQKRNYMPITLKLQQIQIKKKRLVERDLFDISKKNKIKKKKNKKKKKSK